MHKCRAANSGHVTHPRNGQSREKDHNAGQIHVIPVRRNSFLRRLPRHADHCLTRGLTNDVCLSTDWCTRDYVPGEGRHADAIETGRQTETERELATAASALFSLSRSGECCTPSHAYILLDSTITLPFTIFSTYGIQ